jgi:hypothetical protein
MGKGWGRGGQQGYKFLGGNPMCMGPFGSMEVILLLLLLLLFYLIFGMGP